jgi:uncharacterized protein (DUF342 family)
MLRERLRGLTAELEEWDKKMAEMAKVLAFAKQNPGKISPQSLQRAGSTYLDAQTHAATLREEVGKLNKQLQLSEDGRIIVEKVLYEGGEVSVGGKRQKIVAERGPGIFRLREGELVYDDPPR